jgi:hypothetical protein
MKCTKATLGWEGFAGIYVWWQALDADLEERVRKFLVCQTAQKLPPKSPVHPWEWPEKSWTRLHIGPVLGKTLLIVADVHLKWIDAHVISSTSLAATIDKLHSTFATHSLPQTIVSDNGPALLVNFRSFYVVTG